MTGGVVFEDYNSEEITKITKVLHHPEPVNSV